ncbi:FAD-binding oxidoreductase [Nocardia cyriacigeorgica]|uniref:FAD-binding oxidoreductase n=1 Tax=Nocardia cyriacigeorgica TaxID=135487 RepID=A0A6P1CKE5_9NOCA|nr:FAD-binding oxidoreductase [Nocardia cyriacigeorgica]NEW32143.1 FAD-binding oxidoreductase [Nocardia cyriacigeorgica]BDU08988.1 putative oxidoreductase [Nocardia cyriacigeorgica]
MSNDPIWWPRGVGAAAGHPPLSGGHDADLAIVGGGLAGLATAYYASIARPDMTIVVLEAGFVGAGATGRSTGIVSPGLSIPLPRLRRRIGDARTLAAFDASQHGVRLLRELIKSEHIDCDARDEPHTLTVLTGRQRARMNAHLRVLAELGRPVRRLTGTELIAAAGHGYAAGFSYDDAMVIDPYRLLAGLVATLRARGVMVYENSRVQSVDCAGRAPKLTTASGVVTARRVLYTVDGYADRLNPMRTSVVALRTHLLATEPLSDAQVAGLGWTGRGGIIDQRNFFNYYRMTADRRLVFGGGPALVPTGKPAVDDARSAAVQRRIDHELLQRFPSLAEVEVAARWSGLTASSTDRLPVVGPVPGQDGCFYAGAWCGHGFAMSVDTAWRFAETLTGGPQPRLPWSRSGAQPVPTALARGTGVRAYLRFLDYSDRTGLRLAGRSPRAEMSRSRLERQTQEQP